MEISAATVPVSLLGHASRDGMRTQKTARECRPRRSKRANIPSLHGLEGHWQSHPAARIHVHARRCGGGVADRCVRR